MTREEAKKEFSRYHNKNDYEYAWISLVIDWVYDDIESYLKAQAEDQRRDFRDRCVFHEVLEHIGGTA